MRNSWVKNTLISGNFGDKINNNIVMGNKEKFLKLVSQSDKDWAEKFGKEISEDIKVEYLSRTMIRLEDDSVDVLVGARFLKESIEVLKIELVYSFEVVDLNDVVKVDETLKKIDFPKSLLCTFLSVSMGSLRGVLYERVKGTELVNYFLPLVDMDVLLGINMFVVKK